MGTTLGNWLADAWHLVVGYDPARPMLFNSGLFLALFTVFIAGYAFLYRRRTARTAYVLAFSLFFYYKSSGAWLLILLASIVLDYAVALAIHRSRDPKVRKVLLVASVTANVGLLCYFKYTNFFLQNLFWVAGRPCDPLDIFLPIGISFYTFQTISYVVDVYKGEIEPADSLLDYAFYMSFFPHLVAGPIVRARHFLPQIGRSIRLSTEEASYGMFQVLRGLVKKAIVADYVSQYVDLVFGQPEAYAGFEHLVAIYAYTLQIYCDFSGYSDMAIGLARIMGFDLGENFRSPYVSGNLTEFWRRWHISLSSWLRDYVYIPLGGNRHGEWKQYLYLFLTMLIGGFWHGASWKFVFWGAMHGAGLVVHKLFVKYTRGRGAENAVTGLLGWLVTFHFVALLWVFFRAESFGAAWQIIGKAVLETEWRYLRPFLETRGLLCLVMALGFAVHFVPEAVKQNLAWAYYTFSATTKAVILILIIQLILQVQTEDVQPFIYFQF
jgi:D-alanyl-lipoteichoic acid acyltransferase DltB (MBOAT superfamily)